jgi:hypothetical protein
MKTVILTTHEQRLLQDILTEYLENHPDIETAKIILEELK